MGLSEYRQKVWAVIRRHRANGDVAVAVTAADRGQWERRAQEGEFAFHKKDTWRTSEDFLRQTDDLFRHFGFERQEFRGRTVLDVGAGSRLRTKFFDGARLVVIEPLADRYVGEISWSDLRDADAVYSRPAEELVDDLVGQVDLAVSLNVLDHCFDFPAIIDNIRRYLKPDGLAFLSYDMHARADALHPLSLTAESSAEIFREKGLRVEQATTGMGTVLGGVQTYGHGPYTLNFWLRRDDPPGQSDR